VNRAARATNCAESRARRLARLLECGGACAEQWRVDLGAGDVADAWLDGHALWVKTTDGRVRGLARETGTAISETAPPAPARDPRRAGTVRWEARGDHLEVVDATTGAIRARIPEH
jgi:hypothetical protein